MFCRENAGAMPLRTSRHCGDLLLCVSRLGSLARLLICAARGNIRRAPAAAVVTESPRSYSPSAYHTDREVPFGECLAGKGLVQRGLTREDRAH